MSGAERYLPFAVLVLCVATIYPLQRWIDSGSTSIHAEHEALYLSNPESVRRLSLGYQSLLADVYWIRSVQYFGSKIFKDPNILNEARSKNLDLLYPLLDITTTLDPKFIPAYRFGGFFIHDYVDPVKAYTLLEKGVRNNPENIWLLQDAAFLYWSDGRCEEAQHLYEIGARVPNAPPWMSLMAAHVVSECGDIGLAKALYQQRLDDPTSDERVRESARRKLLQIQAKEEVDLLTGALDAYRQRYGAEPPSLAELVRIVSMPRGPGIPEIRVDASGAPVDPNGVPYLYDQTTRQIIPNPQSLELPQRVFSPRAN